MSEENLDDYIANAPEPAPELEGDVRPEAQPEGEQQVDSSDTPEGNRDIPDSSGNKVDDGPGKVAKLMQKMGIGKKSDTDSDTKEGDTGEGDIPNDFTNWAREQNWTDDQISEFASGLNDEELLETISYFEDSEQPESDEGQTKQEPMAQQPDKSESKDLTKLKEEIREELRKEFEAELGDYKKEREAQTQQNLVNAANKAFDEAGEKFPVFGKTEELLKYPAGPKKGQYVPTSPAMKARSEVWTKAAAFMNLGETPEEAMQNAITWYKGKNLEKEIRDGVVKDLKKHSTKLSAKRSGKETVKEYEDEDERRADVVREAARRAGVKGNFDL